MKLFRIFFVFCLLAFACARVVHAQDSPSIQDHINELQQKITDLQGQENTLSKQINLITSEISLTSLRIDSTKTKISTLLDEITQLENEVVRLEEVLTTRLALLAHRIPAAYKRSAAPQFGILLFSRSISDFIARTKYLRSVQEEDAALVFQVKATQNSYNESKQVREEKKKQLEQVKIELERQTVRLAQQKREKQVLLDETRNSEAVYQRLLAQALAEKLAIDQALINSVQVGPIKRGDPIALVGNTGYPDCSTGSHLHFEVRKSGIWVDPSQYLSNKTVVDEQNGGTWSAGSGSWAWPLADTIRLTQHFGKTPWSYRYPYSGYIHTGYDMTSSSVVIRAPADGTLYSSSQTCGGSIIKIKYIDHGDSLLSLYLHVQ